MTKAFNTLKYLSLFLLLCCTTIVQGQEFPEKPVPPRLVNDFAGLLNSSDAQELEYKLVAFNDSTTVQIAVVIVDNLFGYDKGDYAQRLAQKWGIGQQGSNNGVLILVKTKTGSSDGQVFIAPGYGLEGVIPDIITAEIVDKEILPAFRNGDYYTGLNRATSVLMSLAKKEFSADEYMNRKGSGSSSEGSGAIGVIIMIVIVIAVLAGRKGGGGNGRNISSKGLPFWLLLSMMNSGRGSHNGSWGGFSGGGGGGGGFGGFGGGSFGGGGAGGSW